MSTQHSTGAHDSAPISRGGIERPIMASTRCSGRRREPDPRGRAGDRSQPRGRCSRPSTRPYCAVQPVNS